MITHDPRWSLTRGNTLVPSRWQATTLATDLGRLGWASIGRMARSGSGLSIPGYELIADTRSPLAGNLVSMGGTKVPAGIASRRAAEDVNG
jgi:hypothetical protein